MGLKNWWNSGNKAEEFLSTGVYNDVVLGGFSEPSDLSRPNRCTVTSDCASGYACVDGVCTLMGPGGSSQGGNAATAGSYIPGANGIFIPGTAGCEPPRPIPDARPCNDGGSSSCQSQANCGDDPTRERRKCCGTRTCSFSAFGVACVCDGDINFESACAEFCDSYASANGTNGPGCSEEQACGECNDCENSECVPKPSQFQPCWCDGGESCSEEGCEQCVTDPDDQWFGDCRFTEEDCQDCATITNYLCPCGKVLTPITVCKPIFSGSAAINDAQAIGRRKCDELCNDNTECDCNCHDDCPDCEICSSEGVCVPDPECEEELFEYVYYWDFFDEGLGGVTSNNIGGPPQYAAGPYGTTDAPFASIPHTFTRYDIKRRNCDGSEFISEGVLFRYPLGTTPYFPDNWRMTDCNIGCLGTDC